MAISIAAALVAGPAAWVVTGFFLPGPQTMVREDRLSPALIGGPFTLTRADGAAVTDRDFRGRYLILFFGFTRCPDVCPTELSVIAAALDRLGGQRQRFQPVFVTLDPDRDDAKAAQDYAAAFGPGFTGLSGSATDIAAAAKAFKVYYRKVPLEGSAGDYTVDHTSIVYVMAPDGTYATHFDGGTGVDAMADALKKLP